IHQQNKSDIAHLNWGEWSSEFLRYYNECLKIKRIGYVKPIYKSPFRNKKASKKCYRYAKEKKSNRILFNAAAKRRAEWERMEYGSRKKKKINLIVK
ncbi:MAG: hypothetical protein JXQ76_03835, partial [Campylobacterales bacterium]|nr:hypothetical protein [Campylobacterales bacterium]